MRYIITLNNVKRSDLESVGFRALDLAILREKRLNIPLTFVINNQAFEDFMNENGLKPKIEKVFQKKKPLEAYKEILKMFDKAVIPKDLEAELSEAYESLAIDPGATANNIVSEWDYPFINLIRSPSYLLPTEDTNGIIQNIRGKELLIVALKQTWASMYSPKSINYRKKISITDSFGLGMLVQKMKRIKQSAVSYSCLEFDEDTILVKGFIGFQDYSFEEEILGKDCHEIDKDTLIIKKAQVNVQEYGIVRDAEHDELVKHELGEQGSKQKLDDKQIAEVARVTKRAGSFIGKHLKLYLGVRGDYTYIFLANRLMGEPRKVMEEKEEVKLGVDEEGKKVMEHKEEIIAGKEEGEKPVKMPKIISKEEARKEVLKKEPEEEPAEEKPVLKELPELDEELKKDIDFLEEIKKKEGEGEVEKEVNLLEETLQIREILERMEEHALNNNKEAYAQEAKKLKEMINRVKGE